jgi:hypothetical protein
VSEETTKKRRRTPSELKAHLMGQIKVQEEREKAEAVRLISDAHDTLVCAAALEAAKPHIAALNAAKTHLSAVLAALAPKP